MKTASVENNAEFSFRLKLAPTESAVLLLAFPIPKAIAPTTQKQTKLQAQTEVTMQAHLRHPDFYDAVS